jgi:hypothetical protein
VWSGLAAQRPESLTLSVMTVMYLPVVASGRILMAVHRGGRTRVVFSNNIALRAEDLRQAVRTGQNEGHAP